MTVQELQEDKLRKNAIVAPSVVEQKTLNSYKPTGRKTSATQEAVGNHF